MHAPKRQNGPPFPQPSSCEIATPLHRRTIVSIAPPYQPLCLGAFKSSLRDECIDWHRVRLLRRRTSSTKEDLAASSMGRVVRKVAQQRRAAVPESCVRALSQRRGICISPPASGCRFCTPRVVTGRQLTPMPSPQFSIAVHFTYNYLSLGCSQLLRAPRSPVCAGRISNPAGNVSA